MPLAIAIDCTHETRLGFQPFIIMESDRRSPEDACGAGQTHTRLQNRSRDSIGPVLLQFETDSTRSVDVLDEPGKMRDAWHSLRCSVSDIGSPPSIASLTVAAERGDAVAAEKLFETLYSELRRIAKFELARSAGYVSLSATTLLHEAYLAMASREGPVFPDRPRFMGYAARVMRTFIIDHARERHAQKRGGLFEITSLDTTVMENPVEYREVAEIGAALDELGKIEPSLAEIVDLKFFCGLSFVEIAALRGVSMRTVQRNWERARIYLHRKIGADLPAE